MLTPEQSAQAVQAGTRLPVTVVIPALNEGDGIAEAVGSALDWADEVIVVDGGSCDDTVARASAMGASVDVWTGGTIGGQRNRGASLARNQWVFALDVDERASTELRKEMSDVLRAPAHSSYRVRMRNFYLGRERTRGRWGRDWHVRLYRRDCTFSEKRVHEGVECSGSVGQLNATVTHTPYRDMSHHLTKMITYARLGALDLREHNRRATIFDLSFRPFWRFLRDFVVYGGWRDGRYGFINSALAGYSALLKYAFLYSLDHPDVPQGRADSVERAIPGELRSTGRL